MRHVIVRISQQTAGDGATLLQLAGYVGDREVPASLRVIERPDEECPWSG